LKPLRRRIRPEAVEVVEVVAALAVSAAGTAIGWAPVLFAARC
jgi:hypothetical protein